MTLEPYRERGGIEPTPDKPLLSHGVLDVALLHGIQGVEVLEHRRMNEGDAEMYQGAVDIARLNYEAEYRDWRSGKLGLNKIDDKRLPRVPSFEAVADNLQYGAVEKVSGAKVVTSLDLHTNVRIAALMNAARLVEGRAVTESGPLRLAKRAGVMAIELAGGEASVSNSQLYLQKVVNKIIETSFDQAEQRNIGPWASPFLWAEAIDKLKDLKLVLPKDRHEEIKYLTIPLAVGLEQSLVHTKNWLVYPGKILSLKDKIHQARMDARYGRLSAEFVGSLKRQYPTGEALAAAMEHARQDAFMRKLLIAFTGEKAFVPRPRRPQDRF